MPREYWWVYGYINPDKLQFSPPRNFAILTKNGAVGVGTHPLPSWHKRQGEDLLRLLDIKIEHGEELKQSDYRGTFTTISDIEHAKIVEAYAGGKGMKVVGGEMKRSSGSIHNQIEKHNVAINRSGFCPRCGRAKGSHESERMTRETFYCIGV